MEDFYIEMISHYENRIKDKSIPILIRAQFKQTLNAYKEKLQQLTFAQFNHSQKLLPC